MRYAQESDLPAIVAIYNAAIPTRLATADTEPVSVESKRAWFNAHTPERHPLLVHEIDGEIVAWVAFHPFYDRPAYDHTAEVSLYIAPAHQGKGLGKQLLTEGLTVAQQAGIKTIISLIFSHNVRSLNLFRSFDFEEWGQLPNVTEMDGNEYSVTMQGKRITP